MDRIEIVYKNEQEKLIEWTTSNYKNFSINPNHEGYYKHISEIDDIEIYSIINLIKERLIKTEKLEKYILCEELKDFLYYMQPGTKLHNHIDYGSNDKEDIHFRFNVCIQKPELGGNPIYSGNTIKLEERKYIICRAGLDFHTSEWISGEKAKINLSFGFMIKKQDVHMYTNREQIIKKDNSLLPISVWNIPNLNNDSLLSALTLLDNNKKYLLNYNDNINNFNVLEKYIYDLTTFHMNKKGIILDKHKHFIEFNIYKSNGNSKVHVYKDSIFSTITALNDSSVPFFFTEIDTEQYKYKEIPNKNIVYFYYPTKNSHALFNSCKYYGGLKYNCKESNIYLVTSLLESIQDYSNYYKKDNDLNLFNESLLFNENTNISTTNIHGVNLTEQLLYNNNNDKFKELFHKFLKEDADHNLLIVNDLDRQHNDYMTLFDKYGETAIDIFPLINRLKLKENNRFLKNKIIQSVLSLDVCYWIINECETKNNWIDDKLKDYNKILNVEDIPSVFSFILFVSNFYFINIRKLYNLNDDIKLNIKNIYVSKTQSFRKNSTTYIDGNLLTINIQLNDKKDYIGGEIVFYEETAETSSKNKILLNQGDMLIYNGLKPRTDNLIENGEKYVLVMDIEFIV